MEIQKRDGTKQDFRRKKITNAILKAFVDVDGEVSDYAISKSEKIADFIEGKAQEELLTIDKIQEMVENGLMSTKRRDVARAYIEYRHDRDQVRRWKNDMMAAMEQKLTGSNIENSNANMDENSFGGRKGEATNIMLKQYALDNCMSKKSKKLHLSNHIYIHDLDNYALGTHNCLTLPIDKLLAEGFNTRQTDIRPANSVNTAFQLLAVLFQLQSLMQFGGVSASHLDWSMVPYVRKSFWKYMRNGMKYIYEVPDEYRGGSIYYKHLEEVETWIEKSMENNEPIENGKQIDYKKLYDYAIDMTKREIQQAVEGMYHNLNTLQSRSGNQLPFSSINFGTCTEPEGRMIIKALLEGSIKGVGKLHKTPIFPCSIFQMMSGVNRHSGEPNYDLYLLALESTSKRLYPNYCNVDWSVNAGYDRNDPETYVSTMGCRTYNGLDINAPEGQNPQKKDGRGNICPVTVILPTYAMEAVKYYETKPCGDYEEDVVRFFFQLLEEAIDDAKDMLLERYKYICSQSAASAKFMYENETMRGYVPEEGIESALKHGTLALGQLGVAETLEILIGKNQLTDEGMELAKRIEQLFKEKCAKFKQEYKLNFGVYFTPAESLCYTAMKKFQDKYGKIPKISENEFFTNSIHVPVWEEINPFEKIDIESQLTGYSNAGCITYVEFDSSVKNNLEALEQVVNYAMDKDIPYFAINVPSDTCLDCGFQEEIPGSCPQCGGDNIQRLRRVTGYLTGDYKTAFNLGKQQETVMRYKHSKKMI